MSQKTFHEFHCPNCGHHSYHRTPGEKCALCRRHPERTGEEIRALRNWLNANGILLAQRAFGKTVEIPPPPFPLERN